MDIKTVEDWFENRTISSKTLERFGVTWDKNKITIPICDPNGKHIFNKYRRSPFIEEGPKYRYDKGATSALFGAHLIKDAHTVVICEGELDALALWSHGFEAVSTTGGAGTFDPRWADLLAGKKVIICYDNDTAGYKGALNVQAMLPDARIALLPEKSGVKDITDYLIWLRDNGKTFVALAEAFDQAMSYPMEEYMIPEKASERKDLKRQYVERIEWAYRIRRERTQYYLPTTFIDHYIEKQQELVQEIVREMKKARYKRPEGSEKSLAAAKLVPMTQYIKFDRQSFAVCPFHGEKTPSLHYILKSNKAYCFGACQKAYDVVDIVMNQRGCSLTEAVNFILS